MSVQAAQWNKAKEIQTTLAAGEVMMKAHVLKGSKQEIAEGLVQINGDVREAIVFVAEPAGAAPIALPDEDKDIFAEIHSLMVDVPEIDDSREAIYSPMESQRVAST